MKEKREEFVERNIEKKKDELCRKENSQRWKRDFVTNGLLLRRISNTPEIHSINDTTGKRIE